MADLLSDFLALEPPTVAHIIGRGVFPVGAKLVLGGPPKANKSFVALNLALNLARGQHIFGAAYRSGTPVLPVAKSHSVLYIEQEIGAHSLQERLRKLVPPEASMIPLYIKSRDTGMRIDTEEGRDLIEAELAQCRPDVVIFDPLAKFHLSDENSSQEMGAIMRVGDHWIEDYKTSLIYLHHTGHENFQNPRRGGDKLRGSTAIFADADTVCLIERKSAPTHPEPTLELNFEIRHGEPLEVLYVKRLRDGSIHFAGEDFVWGGRTAYGGRPKKESYRGI